ncbi:MAG TPA: 30S ribosomal protein S2 [Candidatus Nanoarchaeia archaeon]|nr:30S ribosomal protein S2 [Candidatus Nanoarchaeia archaeon]
MAENQEMLVPLDEYLKAGIHIGTKFKTAHMAQFIYKARPDGLFILNLQKIDERLAICANLIAQYAPEDILVASRRENSWKAVNAFSKETGVRAFAGRYPPGVLTNTSQKNFTEAKIIIVTDAWLDRNTLNDAMIVRIPVIALCDTNNQANNIDFVLPCNNKGKKSLGLVFWLLAREYKKQRGLGEMALKLEDFVDE